MHWLHNEDLMPVLFRLDIGELLFEVVHLRWKDPSLGKEVVVLLEYLLHSLQVPAQVILPGQLIHPREVIDPLIVLQLRELLREHPRRIVPKDVPIGTLIVSQLEPEHLHCFFNHCIAALGCAEK